MARFGAILTNYGNAAITNAFLTGKMVNVTEFALGDGGGSAYTPTPGMTELRREKWRAAVAHGEIDPERPNVVTFYAVLPPDVDIGTIREMATFDDQGKMVGVANTPEIEKVSFEEGVALDAILAMEVEVVHAEVVKYEVNPYIIIATKRDMQVLDNDLQLMIGQNKKSVDEALAALGTKMDEIKKTSDNALPKTSKAADSSKLEGQPASYYAKATDLSTVKTTADNALPKVGKAADSSKLGGQLPNYYAVNADVEAALLNKANLTKQEWFDIPLSANWQNISCQYSRSQFGVLTISGLVRKNTSIQGGEIIATLPAGFRPLGTTGFFTSFLNINSEPCHIHVIFKADGTISTYSANFDIPKYVIGHSISFQFSCGI